MKRILGLAVLLLLLQSSLVEGAEKRATGNDANFTANDYPALNDTPDVARAKFIKVGKKALQAFGAKNPDGMKEFNFLTPSGPRLLGVDNVGVFFAPLTATELNNGGLEVGFSATNPFSVMLKNIQLVFYWVQPDGKIASFNFPTFELEPGHARNTVADFPATQRQTASSIWVVCEFAPFAAVDPEPLR